MADRITAATVTAECTGPQPVAPAFRGTIRRPNIPENPPPCPAPTPTPGPDTAIRADLRNVAIVAHVDHGKTTLVDAMLRQTGAFRANQAVVDRVMDSGDLEREKGITILAKQTTVDHAGVRLNIVDTPGHADFGGEVERSLLMVDSVLLLVDAAEGPLPQTRYVLQKAMARRCRSSWRSTRSTAATPGRPRSSTTVYELFMDLGADEHQIDFPVVYTNAKAGTATLDLEVPGRTSAAARPARRGHAAGHLHARATRSSSWSRTCRRTSTSGGWRSGGSGTARSGWASGSRSSARRPTTRRAPSSRAGR